MRVLRAAAAGGDYHLVRGSAGIDAAPADFTFAVYDLDRNTRVHDLTSIANAAGIARTSAPTKCRSCAPPTKSFAARLATGDDASAVETAFTVRSHHAKRNMQCPST